MNNGVRSALAAVLALVTALRRVLSSVEGSPPEIGGQAAREVDTSR
jgi:hypothetical protein